MPNLANLVNTRPKANQHVVARVSFAPGTNDGPAECKCGAEMRASEFTTHRRKAGIAEDPRSLGVPEMLRGTPNVWQHSCRVPKCDKPGSKAKGYCGGHYERVLRGKSLDTPLGLPRGKAA